MKKVMSKTKVPRAVSNVILRCYKELIKLHGPQGWWPLTNNTPKYHKRRYDLPRDERDRFEICVGSILTQNTTWKQVEKVLELLIDNKLLTPKAILEIDQESLSKMIRPAGYFNQKAKKLKIFSEWFSLNKEISPSREKLLSLWGIGPETADSILLYAFNTPTFVVDAYTKRIFSHLGIVSEKCSYNKVKTLFEEKLPKELIIYQEYHALIVEHAKKYYSKKPYGDSCPLLTIVSNGLNGANL